MKKILSILLFLPILLSAQIKVKNLPTTTTGTTGDYLIKDDAGGAPGATKKISIADFITAYSLGGGTATLADVLAVGNKVNGLKIESNSGNSYLDLTTGNMEFNDAAVGRWYLYTPANGRSVTLEWDGKTSTALGHFAIDSVDSKMDHTKQLVFDAPRYTFETATATNVPFFNYRKDLVASIIDSAEFSRLDGVTSNIQTQINALAGGVPSSRLINTTSPITGGGDLSADRTIAINNAVADGSTKGAASFTANDFDASSGNISIDYTNGQSSSGSTKGFLSSTDWTTFNNKGFSMVANGSAFSPADATTYYYGAYYTLAPSIAGINADARRLYPKTPCTLVAASIHIINQSSDGSNEDATFYVRVNNTTDITLSSTVKYNAGASGNVYNITGLSQAFNGTTDYFVIKSVMPTWATNPVNTITYVELFFK